MYKVVFLASKKPGMSDEAFRDYYESTHSKFIKYVPGVRSYTRRYVSILPISDDAGSHERPFDVMVEMSFDDEPAMKKAMAFLFESGRYDEVAADEENLFDRSRLSPAMALTVEECETDLSGVKFAA